MIRPTADEANLFQTLARQYPQFVEYLNRARQDELETLALTPATLSDFQRGRVHALSEMQGLFKVRG